MITFYGWLLLIQTIVLNQFAAAKLGQRTRVGAIVLAVTVPAFTGFALAQIGVRLLGGAP